MVRYKYANGTDAVPGQTPAHFHPLTPTANKPVLFVVEVHTGMVGPQSYHKQLLRGITTLMQAQERFKKVHGPADTADICTVLNFMKELLKDEDYEQATTRNPCITDANG